MDEDQAREEAAAAQDAYRHGSRPTVPLAPSLVSALLAGVGVALLGASSDGGMRILTFVAAVAALGCAFGLPHMLRSGNGLHGYRGPAQRDNTVFLLCAVVLAICGFAATPTLSIIYLALGVVAGLAWFLLLRGRLVSR